MKDTSKSMLLVLLLSSLMISVPPCSVKAAPQTRNATILADAYADKQNPTEKTGSYVIMVVGNSSDAAQWNSYVKFDVASLQAVTPTSVALKLYVDYFIGAPTKNYRVRRVTGSWSESTLDWNTQPSVGGSHVDAAFPTSTQAWWTVDVTSLWVYNTTTISFRVAQPTQGGGACYFVTRNNASSTYHPRLEITYNEGAIYDFHGLYYENGTYSSTVAVNAYFSSADQRAFTVGADTRIYLNNQPMFFSWKAGIYYRLYYPDSASENITLFTPEATYAQYAFTIRDYAGVIDSKSLLISHRVVSNTQHVIESRLIADTADTVPLVMAVGASYLLVLRTGTGYEYRFGWFFAGSNVEPTLSVKAIDFPSNVKLAYRYVLADASRSADMKTITVNYQDTLKKTDNVTLYITYTNGTVAYGPDMSTQQTVQWPWNAANNRTNYIVYLNINHQELGSLSYRKTLAYLIEVSSPFDLSPLGTWPIPSDQVVPVAIILCVAAAFSTLTIPLGLAAVVWTAAILRYIGWFTITSSFAYDLELMAIIGSLMIMYAIYDASRREKY